VGFLAGTQANDGRAIFVRLAACAAFLARAAAHDGWLDRRAAPLARDA
jgi:hypothetical protein